MRKQRDCLTEFTTGSQIAGCSRFDVACVCANDEFINGIGCCLLDACPESDQQVAIDYAAQICGGQGVTVPSEITCTTDGADSAATTASSGSDDSGDATVTGDSDQATATDSDSADTTDTAEGAANTAAVGVGGIAAGIMAAAALL